MWFADEDLNSYKQAKTKTNIKTTYMLGKFLAGVAKFWIAWGNRWGGFWTALGRFLKIFREVSEFLS